MMGGWTGQCWGWERLVKTRETLGAAALMEIWISGRGRQLTFIQSRLEMVLTEQATGTLVD